MLIAPPSIDLVPPTVSPHWNARPLAFPLVAVSLDGVLSTPPTDGRAAGRPGTSRIECADDPDDDEEDLGDEEDLAVTQPSIDEESSFDDFDDEFDDDFEEEENDPDWDHPDDSAPETPPPGKGGGRKK